jgi:hypothetical protein
MSLHNFIRGHDLADSDFELDVQDNSIVINQPSVGEGTASGDETDMGALGDAIVAAMVD